jgi:hypothetical protein
MDPEDWRTMRFAVATVGQISLWGVQLPSHAASGNPELCQERTYTADT